MAIPAFVSYIPAALSALKSLFGGDSPQEKARKRLEELAKRGLDPKLLRQALAIQAAREQQEQSGILSRMRAGNIDPSSGLAQEAIGASKRGLAARQGEARAVFDEQSEAAKQRANEILAGMPEDDTFAQVMGSATELLDELARKPTSAGSATANAAGGARVTAALPGVQPPQMFDAPQQRQGGYDFMSEYFPNLRGIGARGFLR